MLEKLEVMVLATDKIKQQAENTVFGHLIILARDLSGPEKAEEIRELLLNDEDAGRSKDRMGATNRNTIRAGLRHSFESIVVRTLPVPHPMITGTFLSIARHILADFFRCCCPHQELFTPSEPSSLLGPIRSVGAPLHDQSWAQQFHSLTSHRSSRPQ